MRRARSFVFSFMLVLACASREEPPFVPGGDAGADGGLRVDAGPRDGGPELAVVGGPCRLNADCAPIAGGADCFTEAEASALGFEVTGGYCTSTSCQVSTPIRSCGLATVCGFITGAAVPTCEAACGSDADCRPGFSCVEGGCSTPVVTGPDGGYPAMWGPPVVMPELNSTHDDWVGAMSADGRRVCFASDRETPGTLHIFCATRNSVAVPFEAPKAQTAINSTVADTSPFLWRNQLYFDSDRDTSPAIYRATWEPAAGAYTHPVRVTELDSAASDRSPSLSTDGLTLYFMSDRPGGAGQVDIWRATRASVTDTFDPPVNVSEVNSSYNEWFPTIAADNSFLTFNSDRPGSHLNSGFRMARAAGGGHWETPTNLPVCLPLGWWVGDLRPMANGALSGSHMIAAENLDFVQYPPTAGPPAPVTAWGAAALLTELNVAGVNTRQPSMTADQLRICFASSRSGGLGDDDIWCASRSTATEMFGVPVNQTVLNSSAAEGEPELSADGTELFFNSYRSGGWQVLRSTWNAASGRYESPMVQPNLGSGDATIRGLALSADALTAVFSTAANGVLELNLATRSNRDANFGHASVLTDLNAHTATGDWEPGLSPDGFTLPFVSTRHRPGSSETQPYLWVTGWKGDGTWTTPVLGTIGGVSPYRAYHPRILRDGSLLFHSPTGNVDALYLAPPLP